MRKLIGLAVLCMFVLSGIALSADEKPAPASSEKDPASQIPVAQAAGVVTDEAKEIVNSGIERRQERREAVAPAAAEVTKEATGVVGNVMEKRQERRQARREALFGPRNKRSDGAVEK